MSNNFLATKNIPLCLPKLPSVDKILPYLEQIDQNRWYSNYGPLIREFQNRASKLFKVKPTQICCASSGTLLLELCLKAMGIDQGCLCIMPAWTFVATPLAAISAQLEPLFVDVDIETQAIDPVKLEENISSISKIKKIGAVIVVSPFGMPLNVKEWDNFTDRTGIPVIIDAAASFDTVLQLPQMQVSSTPIMISLHATKVLGIGEGSIILSTNEKIINQIECLTQFGFPQGIRNAVSFGTNAKMSEYAAAIGLAALDSWSETRSAWHHVSNHYQNLLNRFGIQHMLSASWVPSTCNIILPNQANTMLDALNATGINTRKWWGNGCHQHSIFKQSRTLDLSNTEFLCKSVLGLPFFTDMSVEAINHIVNNLNKVANLLPNKLYAT